jgi:hypothetical protein
MGIVFLLCATPRRKKMNPSPSQHKVSEAVRNVQLRAAFLGALLRYACSTSQKKKESRKCKAMKFLNKEFFLTPKETDALERLFATFDRSHIIYKLTGPLSTEIPCDFVEMSMHYDFSVIDYKTAKEEGLKELRQMFLQKLRDMKYEYDQMVKNQSNIDFNNDRYRADERKINELIENEPIFRIVVEGKTYTPAGFVSPHEKRALFPTSDEKSNSWGHPVTQKLDADYVLIRWNFINGIPDNRLVWNATKDLVLCNHGDIAILFKLVQ